MRNFNQLVLDTNQDTYSNQVLSVNSQIIGQLESIGNDGPEYLSWTVPQAPRKCTFDWTSKIMCRDTWTYTHKTSKGRLSGCA